MASWVTFLSTEVCRPQHAEGVLGVWSGKCESWVLLTLDTCTKLGLLSHEVCVYGD